MATVNLTVKHRPVRIGFVVRAGEAIDLGRVSSFCALLWGGMHNPVIPVASADDASADLLVRAFQVDVLFNTAVDDATTGFVERYLPCAIPASTRGISCNGIGSRRRISSPISTC
jgi:hypothetical protein